MAAVGWSRISEYALIGNCRTAALVSARGSIDWCCFPKFDSPSYFARLLDPSGGHFSITPAGEFTSTQSYLEGTNVARTSFTAKTGSASLTDLISVRAPGVEPNTLWPDEEILRIVEGESGELELDLELFPRGAYGRRPLELSRIGSWGIKGGDARRHFLFQCSLPAGAVAVEAGPAGSGVRARFTVRAGERVIVSLTYSDEAPAVMPPLETALKRRDLTIEYWRGWSARCPSGGAYAAQLKRSALALKLLNYAPSGAFVAAPTASLPEWIGGSRNWDYRFCWLRDASFTTRALVRVGQLNEAKAFLKWLLHGTRLTWPRLNVLYSVYGEAHVPETTATWLSGYRGSRPVRLGNAASAQRQLDVYGEVIESFYVLSEHLHPVERDTRKMVIGFGGAVARLWREPDQGIWELRGSLKHHTQSKLMCWVAMDRLGKLAERYGWRLPYDAVGVAAEIRDEIEHRAFNPELGVYTRAYGETELDASVLMMPLFDYCDATAPRFVATRDAIIRELGRNDLILRYPPGSDGFSEPEGAFTICNFWLSEVFARAGDLRQARRYFEAVTRALGPTGLASEELDPVSLEQLGNTAQGFSHIGLIHAALAMEELAA